MKNPFLIYQAKSFYNAYLALEPLMPAGDELLFMAPKFVNGAFSIELTLKAILGEQGIPYGNEHNLKLLFDKLPTDIQNRVWSYLKTKVPEYSDISKCETELILISEAFVQWRYYHEGNGVPTFDALFLSAFANAIIFVMFDLGYNIHFTLSSISQESKRAAIDKKIEQNRRAFLEKNQQIIQKKKRNEQK